MRFGLQRLQQAQTEELLKSVFGNAPHVQLLSRKLHAIAAGNPRDTMRLAQSLVDRGLARYQLGGWSLPADFDDGVLPASMAQVMLAELTALPSHAQTLARLLSFAGDRDLSFDECVASFPELSPALVHEALQLLVQAQFAKLEAEGFTQVEKMEGYVISRRRSPATSRQSCTTG